MEIYIHIPKISSLQPKIAFESSMTLEKNNH